MLRATEPAVGQPSDQLIPAEIIGGSSPVLIDFDHTLFACNSTELFIASCRPSAVVAVIDFLVRQCVPWRLTGLEHWFRLRDYVCCVAILICCPWNILRWRRLAPGLFAQHVSRTLSDTLSGVPVDRLLIITFGMRFIVEPLVLGTRWQQARLVATPLLCNLRYLMRGKLPLARKRFGNEFIANATFVSDSTDDADLLQAVRLGILVPPQGETFRAAEHLYLPLRYTARVKYTRSYVFDQIVLVEMLITVMSVIRSFGDLAIELPLIFMLTLSLMCVYEIGYHENDFAAARSEAAPTLGGNIDRFGSYPLRSSAWLWAASTGALALLFGREAGVLSRSILDDSLIWAGAMLAIRASFWTYNRVQVRTRVFLYPLLQFLKFAPVFLIVPPTTVGVVLVSSQIATMWMIYLVYRIGGVRRDIQKEAIRTCLLLLGLCLLASGGLLSGPAQMTSLLLIASWSSARLSKAPILRRWRRSRSVNA